MYFSTPKILAMAAVFAGGVYACCSSGCYCVKADSYDNINCNGEPIGGGTAFANYGGDSNCVALAGVVAVTGNNDGCGSSNCDIHWYTSTNSCEADTSGAGGDIPYTHAANSGVCVPVPSGATFMRTVCAGGPG